MRLSFSFSLGQSFLENTTTHIEENILRNRADIFCPLPPSYPGGRTPVSQRPENLSFFMTVVPKRSFCSLLISDIITPVQVAIFRQYARCNTLSQLQAVLLQENIPAVSHICQQALQLSWHPTFYNERSYLALSDSSYYYFLSSVQYTISLPSLQKFKVYSRAYLLAGKLYKTSVLAQVSSFLLYLPHYSIIVQNNRLFDNLRLRAIV